MIYLSICTKVCPHIIDEKPKKVPNLLHVTKYKKIAQILLQLRPTFLDDLCSNGNSVLHSAIRYFASDELIAFFIRAKPSLVTHRNNKNQTPLNIAFQMDQIATVNQILTSKPNLAYMDEKGNSVLHVVLSTGDSSVIALVFSHRIDNLYRCNNEQKTPMCLAIANKNEFAVRLFEPYLTVDMAIAADATCSENWKMELYQQCMEKCKCLHEHLPCELETLVLQFVGIVQEKKRRRDED